MSIKISIISFLLTEAVSVKPSHILRLELSLVLSRIGKFFKFFFLFFATISEVYFHQNYVIEFVYQTPSQLFSTFVCFFTEAATVVFLALDSY